MSKVSKSSGSRATTSKSEQALFHIPDNDVSKISKRGSRKTRSTLHKKSGKQRDSLFPEEIASRTFFIPETGVPSVKISAPASQPNLKSTSKMGSNKPDTARVVLTSNTETKKHPQSAPSQNITSNQQTQKQSFSSSHSHQQKQTINLRTRPKSASALRRLDPKEGKWNCQTACEDWNLRRLDTDAQRWSNLPAVQQETSQKHTRTSRTISQRRPSIPGQVCYGTNTQGVPLPRRPQSAANGRENRPLPVDSDKLGNEFQREEYGGWQPSTLLSDERIGYDRRFRYPQKFAVNDIAAANDKSGNVASKPAWVHTTTSSNKFAAASTKAC